MKRRAVVIRPAGGGEDAQRWITAGVRWCQSRGYLLDSVGDVDDAFRLFRSGVVDVVVACRADHLTPYVEVVADVRPAPQRPAGRRPRMIR